MVLPFASYFHCIFVPHSCLCLPQVWFSHKRRKDKKTQQGTGQAASTAPAANGISPSIPASSSVPPAGNLPPAAVATTMPSTTGPAIAGTSAPAANALQADKPLSSPFPAQLPSATAAAPQVASAGANASAAGAFAPAAAALHPGQSTLFRPTSIQVPASVQLPYAHLNGTAAIPSRLPPAGAQQMPHMAPQSEQLPRSQPPSQTQAQPMFRPEPLAAPSDPLSQTARLNSQPPRQFLPHQYPPQSFLAAQQNARLGTGSSISAFQPSLPVSASPARLAMTPMSSLTPTPAAVAAAAAASAPAMPSARSSPYIPEHQPASIAGIGHTPDAAYMHDSHMEAMHEESDAGTEDFDTAPLSRGMHAEWRELVEYAKPSLPVPFRTDGPQLAFVFDDPPSPDGADGNDADAPAKRKRVMVDGYEMEEDGEDGMNVSTQLCLLPVY